MTAAWTYLAVNGAPNGRFNVPWKPVFEERELFQCCRASVLTQRSFQSSLTNAKQESEYDVQHDQYNIEAFFQHGLLLLSLDDELFDNGKLCYRAV